jgi:hypothetical protein
MAAKIPHDLGNAEEGMALAYWRGHMDARMDDLTGRITSIESKVDNIHKAVQDIATKLEAREAAAQQAKSIIRWIAPDSAAAIAIILAVIAIASRFIP